MLTKKLSFTCHKCGKEFEHEVPLLVNSRMHPDTVKDIITGDLFVSTCQYCGERVSTTYPLTYVNDEKNLVVITGPYDVLLYRKYFKHIDDDYPGYKVIGTSRPVDFHNIVTLIESGYDYHEGMITIYLENQRKHLKALKQKPDIGEVDFTVLDFNKKGNAVLDTCFKNSEKAYRSSFDKALERVRKANLDLEWNERNLYIYNNESIHNLLEKDKEKVDESFKLAFIHSYDSFHFCSINEYLNEHIKDNQMISFINSNNSYRIGRYLETLSIDNRELLTEVEHFGIVTGPIPHMVRLGFTKIPDNLDNSELLELLRLRKDKKEYNMDHLMTLLSNADIICSIDEISRLFDKAPKIDNGNEKKFLHLYLSGDTLDNYHSYQAIKFEDIVRIASECCCDRVVINENTDNIYLGAKFLEDFKHCRLMCDSESIKELISTLTKEEFDYIGEIGLNIIGYAYEEGVDCFDEAEKVYGYSEKEIDDILDDAYEKMINVVDYRFNVENKKYEDIVLS